MGDVNVNQGQALTVAESVVDLRLTQASVFALINFPAESLRVTAAETRGVVKSDVAIRISQFQVLAVVRGRIDNRRVRAWLMKLDGHVFYILRLGEISTLVFDRTTGQWSEWRNADLAFLRQHVGMNWTGMGRTTAARGFESTIVAGDDTYGRLWLVDPDLGYDEAPNDGEPVGYPRKVVGGLPMRMRDTVPCGAVNLTASIGQPTISGAGFTLRTSDDFGENWTDHGTVTVTPGDYSQEFSWRALGLMKHPGRLFEITDTGAAARIDSLDMR